MIVGIVVHRGDLDVALHRRAFARGHVDIVDEQRRLVGAGAGQRLVHRRVDVQAVEGGHARAALRPRRSGTSRPPG